jgi:hypothetical protein
MLVWSFARGIFDLAYTLLSTCRFHSKIGGWVCTFQPILQSVFGGVSGLERLLRDLGCAAVVVLIGGHGAAGLETEGD